MASVAGIDGRKSARSQLRNLVHTVALVGGLAVIMAASAWLIYGWSGILWAIVATGLFAAFVPRIPPETVMRMYRAQPVDPHHGGQLHHILEVLADRAELPAIPRLYVIPSLTLNAFATGTPERSAVALTEGLLRRLSMREIAGVMAHEISHVRNRDLFVMGLADAMSRFMVILFYIALALAVLNLPLMVTGHTAVSWKAIVLLYLAPALGSLLQLALSRTREFDADLDGVMLTGDTIGLASALRRLERDAGHVLDDFRMPIPGRRTPQPSLLRSHPSTEERVRRLRDLQARSPLEPILIVEEPLVSMVGAGPASLLPRVRWPGVYY